MAFSFTLDREIHIGGARFAFGNYNASGVTGGDIKTGMAQVNQFFLTPQGTTVSGDQSVYNETMPVVNTDGTITIVTTASEKGSWLAIGI